MPTDRFPTVVLVFGDGIRDAKTSDAVPEAVEAQQPRTGELGGTNAAGRRGRL